MLVCVLSGLPAAPPPGLGKVTQGWCGWEGQGSAAEWEPCWAPWLLGCGECSTHIYVFETIKAVCTPSPDFMQRCSPLQNHHTDWSSAFHSSFVFCLKLSAVLNYTSLTCFVSAGSELCAAGQVGRSQTDAGEAGHPAACCQEHVQADGHSAQQDALLQCKITYQ